MEFRFTDTSPLRTEEEEKEDLPLQLPEKTEEKPLIRDELKNDEIKKTEPELRENNIPGEDKLISIYKKDEEQRYQRRDSNAIPATKLPEEDNEDYERFHNAPGVPGVKTEKIWSENEQGKVEDAQKAYDDLLANSENPEYEKDKLSVVKDYAELTGMDFNYIYNNLDALAKATYQDEPAGEELVRRFKAARENSKLQMEISDLYNRYRFADDDERAEIDLRASEIARQMTPPEEGKGNFFKRNFFNGIEGAVQQFPMWTRSFLEGAPMGLATGISYAGMAAWAGQAGPQAATLEEVVTVPGAFGTGFLMGQATGSANAMRSIQRGNQFKEFLDVGLSEDLAWTMADIIGASEGFLEVAQAGAAMEFLTGVGGKGFIKLYEKAMKKSFKDQAFNRAIRTLAAAGENVAVEATEEAVQQLSTVIATHVAYEVHNQQQGIIDNKNKVAAGRGAGNYIKHPTITEDIDSVVSAFTDSINMLMVVNLPALSVKMPNSIMKDAAESWKRRTDQQASNSGQEQSDAIFNRTETSKTIPVENIQPREGVTEEKYAAGQEVWNAAQAGQKLEPIKVVEVTPGNYRVASGNTNFYNLLENGSQYAEVEVVKSESAEGSDSDVKANKMEYEQKVNDIARKTGGLVKVSGLSSQLIYSSKEQATQAIETIRSKAKTWEVTQNEYGSNIRFSLDSGYIADVNITTKSRFTASNKIMPMLDSFLSGKTSFTTEETGAFQGAIDEYKQSGDPAQIQALLKQLINREKTPRDVKETASAIYKATREVNEEIFKSLQPSKEKTNISPEKQKEAWELTPDEYNEKQNPIKEAASNKKQQLNTEVLKNLFGKYFPDWDSEKKDAAVGIADAIAKYKNQETNDWLNENLRPEVFSNTSPIAEALNQKKKKAAVDFTKDSKALIHLSENSDFSSWVHEIGHVIRRNLNEADMKAVEKELGIEDGKWSRENEEAFVRMLEDHLKNKKETGTIFDKIAAWFKEIYYALRENIEVPKEVARVFDDIFFPEEVKLYQDNKSIDNNNILYQSIEKSSILTEEELEEIGVSYGSEKDYKRAWQKALKDFDKISTGKKRQQINYNGRRLKRNTSLIPFDKIKRIDITGKVVNNSDEIAALLHHFRNPRVEILNILFLNDKNEILSHSAFSSGLPSLAYATELYDKDQNFKNIKEKADRLKATQIYIAHNHPSGNPSASWEDHNITNKYSELLGDIFQGQIILDHTEYNYIVPEGRSDNIFKLKTGNGKNYVSDRRKEFPQVSDQHIVGNVFKNVLTQKESTTAFVGLDNGNKIVSWSYSDEKLDSNEKFRELLRVMGGARAILATNDKERFNIEIKRQIAYKLSPESSSNRFNDIFLDIVLVDKETGELLDSSENHDPDWQHKLSESHRKNNPGPGKIVSNENPQTDLLFQPDEEHEELVRKAVEEGRPVPENVLKIYSSRSWAKEELEKREMLKSLTWVIDEAKTFDSADEFQDYMEFSEDAPTENMTDQERKKWYSEIWSRANRLTPEQAQSKWENDLKTDEQVDDFIGSLLGYFHEMRGNMIHPRILSSLIKKRNGKALSKADIKMIRGVLTGEEVRKYREMLARLDGNIEAIEQLEYESNIENIDPTSIDKKLEKMTINNRMKLAIKTEDADLKKKILTGDLSNKGIIALDKAYQEEINSLEKKIDKWKDDSDWGNQILSYKDKKLKQQSEDLKKLEREKIKIKKQLEKSKGNMKIQLAKMKEQKDKKYDEMKASFTDALKSARQEVKLEVELAKNNLKEVYKKKDDLKKIRDYKISLARRILKDPAKNCDYSYKARIRELQIFLDGHFRRMETEISKATAKAIIELDHSAYLKRDAQIVLPPEAEMIIKKIEDDINKKPLNLWTITELENLDSEIRQLRTEGRNVKYEKEEARKKDLHIDGAKIVKEILKGEKPKFYSHIGSSETEDQMKSSFWGKYGVALTFRPTRVIKYITGGETGKLYDWYITKLNKNLDKTLEMQTKRQDAGAAAMKKYGITAKTLAKEITVTAKAMYSGEVKKSSYTTDEVIHFYVGMKNERNAAALMYGNKIENIQSYINQLTANEKAWGDWMLAEFEQHKERLREAVISDTNEDMGSEKNYFTMVRQDANYEDLQTEMIDQMAVRNSFKKGFANKSFANKRINISKEHQIPIKLGATKIWSNQIEKQEHYINNAEYIKDLHYIMDKTGLKETLMEKHGRDLKKWFDDYINTYANPNIYKFYSAADTMSQKLRSNMAVAYLAFNMTTVLKQAPSIALFTSRAGGMVTGPMRLAIAAEQVMTHPKKWVKFIEENDPQWKARTLSRFTEELKQRSDKDKMGTTVKKVGQAGMTLIMMMDKYITASGWLAVYNANKKNGHENAVAAAQMAVNETQPAGRGKDLPALLKSNSWAWFTMFSNQLNQIWNIIAADIPQAIKKGQINKAMADVAGISVSATAMVFLSGWRPSENDENGKNFIVELLKQYAGYLPLLGKGFQSGISGWMGNGTDPLPLAYEIGKTVNVLSDEKPFDLKKGAKLAESAGVLMGAPIMGIKRPVEAVKTTIEEESLLDGFLSLFGRTFKNEIKED